MERIFQHGMKAKDTNSPWDVVVSFCEEGKGTCQQLLDHKIQYPVSESKDFNVTYCIICLTCSYKLPLVLLACHIATNYRYQFNGTYDDKSTQYIY